MSSGEGRGSIPSPQGGKLMQVGAKNAKANRHPCHTVWEASSFLKKQEQRGRRPYLSHRAKGPGPYYSNSNGSVQIDVTRPARTHESEVAIMA